MVLKKIKLVDLKIDKIKNNLLGKNVLREIEDIYKRNNLIYTFKKYNNHKLTSDLLPSFSTT